MMSLYLYNSYEMDAFEVLFMNNNYNGTSVVFENMAYVHNFSQKLKPAAVNPHPGSHRLLWGDITQVTSGRLTFTWML